MTPQPLTWLTIEQNHLDLFNLKLIHDECYILSIIDWSEEFRSWMLTILKRFPDHFLSFGKDFCSTAKLAAPSMSFSVKRSGSG
jgi:hypothetical protein